MPLVDYHNHTKLCGHAIGTYEQYVDVAIKQKIVEFGFSDHAPIPKHLSDGITMKPDQTEQYINDIEQIRKKYQNDIDIRIGFEVDFPLFDSFDKKYFNDPRIDYLIGSCHFIEQWPFDHEFFIDEFERRDINRIYEDYYNIIEQLVESRLFNIVGHFDLVKKFGHRATEDFAHTIKKIAGKMSRYNIAAEINSAGLIKPVKEIYPADSIIEIFFKMNVPITLGSDSHDPDLVGYNFNLLLEKIKKAGYKKISGFSKRKRYDIEI